MENQMNKESQAGVERLVTELNMVLKSSANDGLRTEFRINKEESRAGKPYKRLSVAFWTPSTPEQGAEASNVTDTPEHVKDDTVGTPYTRPSDEGE